MATLKGDGKLSEGFSSEANRGDVTEGCSAKLGKTAGSFKRAKKTPVVVNEESDGFAGLAENVVALQASVQELSARDTATSSTRFAQQDGIGNLGKRPVNPKEVRRILNYSSSSFQNVGLVNLRPVRLGIREILNLSGSSGRLNLLTHCCCTGHWSPLATNKILWP